MVRCSPGAINRQMYDGGRTRMLLAITCTRTMLTRGVRASTGGCGFPLDVGDCCAAQSFGVGFDPVEEGGPVRVCRSAGADALLVVAVGRLRALQRGPGVNQLAVAVHSG